MEYEQLEMGSKTIFRCITLQDIAGFADLLSPSCLLVTHFPSPPTLSSGNTSFIEPFRYRVSRKTQLHRLLEEQATTALRQQERYQEHLRRFSSNPDGASNTNGIGGGGGSNGEGKRADDGENNGSGGGPIGLPVVLDRNAAAAAGGGGGVGAGGKGKVVPSAKTGNGGVAAPTAATDRKGGKNKGLPPLTTAPWPDSTSAAGRVGQGKGKKSEEGPSGGGIGEAGKKGSGMLISPTKGAGGGGLGEETPFGHSKTKKTSTASPLQAGRGSLPMNTNTTTGSNHNNNVIGSSQRSSSRPYSAGMGSTVGRTDPLGVQLYFHSETELVSPFAPEAAQYHTHLDISDSPLLVLGRFYELLSWMSTSKYIAEPKPTLHPRKGILQDNEVLPPPPAPRSLRERFLMLGKQYTDRNQSLSQLCITWGKETLLFHDVYYFLEGKVVTIHRTLVPLKEMLERVFPPAPTASATQQSEMIRQTLLEFYGDTRSITKAVSSSHGSSSQKEAGEDGTKSSRSSGGRESNGRIRSLFPMLDYSFVELAEGDAIRLLQVPPLSGEKHIPKGPRPEVDPRLAKGVFLTDENDPTIQRDRPQRTLIKAKSKKGEEEAYEFDTRQRLAFLDADGDGEDGNGERETVEGLVEVCRKHDANAVRISSCKLQERVDKLALILRGLVANAFITIRSLDLSDNLLTTIPPLTSLPLQKLFLHGNRIRDWREVEEHVCPLPFIRFLTLHGNPIAESRDPPYWPYLLSSLLRHPHRLVRLKQLDFVTLTAQDYNVAGSFDLFHSGNRGILEAEKAYRTGVRFFGKKPMPKDGGGPSNGGGLEDIWALPDGCSKSQGGAKEAYWMSSNRAVESTKELRWRGLNSIGISHAGPPKTGAGASEASGQFSFMVGTISMRGGGGASSSVKKTGGRGNPSGGKLRS